MNFVINKSFDEVNNPEIALNTYLSNLIGSCNVEITVDKAGQSIRYEISNVDNQEDIDFLTSEQ